MADYFSDCRFLVFFCKVRIVAVQPWNFFLIRDVVCFDYSSRLRSAYFDSSIVRIICEFVQAPVGEVQTELHWIRIQELQDCCSLLFRYSSWFSRILFPLKDPQSKLIELFDYFFDLWSVKVQLLRDLFYCFSFDRKVDYSCSVFDEAFAVLEIL